VLAGETPVLVHNTGGCPDIGEVRYGSNDLSQVAYDHRMQHGVSADQNVAVFEYRNPDGSLSTVSAANIPGGPHSEALIHEFLQGEGILPSAVTRIFSERVPCSTAGCAGIVGQYAREGARVSWSFSGSTTENWLGILRIMSDGI
jgi:hypothetical protein